MGRTNGRQAYAISHQSSDLKIHFVLSGLTEFLSKLDQRYCMTSIGGGAGIHHPLSD